MNKEEQTNHPSYGSAVVVSTTGGTGDMFMSGVKQDHRVALIISHASSVRSLGFAHVHPQEEIVRVEFSELQWGQLMSRMGHGGGTPCTIRRIGQTSIPACPPDCTFESFAEEAQKTAKKAMSSVTDLRKFVTKYSESVKNKPSVGKRELLDFLTTLSRDMGSAESQVIHEMPFVATAIQEHAEGIVEDAQRLIAKRAEVEAARLGIAPASMLASLSEGKKEES